MERRRARYLALGMKEAEKGGPTMEGRPSRSFEKVREGRARGGVSKPLFGKKRLGQPSVGGRVESIHT
jgi:hypothetical protein